MSEPHSEPEEANEIEVQPSCPPDDEKPTASECQDEEGKSQGNEGERPTASERQDEEDKPKVKEDEKPTASERQDEIEEDKSQVNEKSEATPQEEETTTKPVAKQLQKLLCSDPTGTVDIRMGSSGITADKLMTVAQFFNKTFDWIPNNTALCWKNKKEDPWQSITYTEYKALIYNVAKSFLKVMYY